MTNQLVIFLHIPKTGGLTLRRIIDRQYEQEQILRYAPSTPVRALRKPRLKCTYGHCSYGLHRHTPQKATYITFLRDPLERILSTYYFICSRPQNKMYHKVIDMSLLEFVNSSDPRLYSPLHNHQTRLICGRKYADLQLAIDHVKKNFAVVGITEMYPESVFVMKQTLGWKNAAYTKKNITKHRAEKNEIAPDIKQTIREKNILDYKLYNYAKQRLRNQLQKLDPQAKKQLEIFVKRHSGR